MRKLLLISIMIAGLIPLVPASGRRRPKISKIAAEDSALDNWPILRRYDLDHIVRIALPLGGIGTGTVSLGGRGDLCDWEIMNRAAKGFVPLRQRSVGSEEGGRPYRIPVK